MASVSQVFQAPFAILARPYIRSTWACRLFYGRVDPGGVFCGVYLCDLLERETAEFACDCKYLAAGRGIYARQSRQTFPVGRVCRSMAWGRKPHFYRHGGKFRQNRTDREVSLTLSSAGPSGVEPRSLSANCV